MNIVDARSGEIVRVGTPVRVGSDPTDWYTIIGVRFRSLFTRTAIVMRHDGKQERVTMPVKLFPKLIYGSRFPVSGVTAIYPS
jgi:hypothetical protein